MKENWVQAWGMSHKGMSLLCFRGKNKTFRLTVHSAVAGSQLRLKLSNRFSKHTVEIGDVFAASCDAQGNRTGENIPLSFDGKTGVTLRAGETVCSDAAAASVRAGSFFCVSIHVILGKLLSGNELDDAALTFCRGNHAQDAKITHQKRLKDAILPVAEKLMGMYLSQPIPLFESIELLNGEDACTIVCFGDSITQQGRWFNPFSERIRARYPGRYAVVNRSITGNRLLRDCRRCLPLKNFFGPKALDRFQWDVCASDSIKYMVLYIGTNDFRQPRTIAAPAREMVTAQEVEEGLIQLVQQARERGISVFAATYTPFGDSADCSPEKDEVRKALNRWLLETDLFDGVADFDAVFAREGEPYFVKEGYSSKDGGHPSPLGGQALAQCIPLEWFVEKTTSVR